MQCESSSLGSISSVKSSIISGRINMWLEGSREGFAGEGPFSTVFVG